MSAMVISSGTSKASIKTFSFRLSLVEYSTRSLANLSKRASCIGRYDSIEFAGCNRLAGDLINRFGGSARRTRRRNYPEREQNAFLPRAVKSTSPGAAFERRPHFPLVLSCTCCKREFLQALGTGLQHA